MTIAQKFHKQDGVGLYHFALTYSETQLLCFYEKPVTEHAFHDMYGTVHNTLNASICVEQFLYMEGSVEEYNRGLYTAIQGEIFSFSIIQILKYPI